MNDDFLVNKTSAYVSAIRRTCQLIDLLERVNRGDDLTTNEKTMLYQRDPNEQTLDDLHKNLVKQAAALTALNQAPPY